jgi:hypothetical protein
VAGSKRFSELGSGQLGRESRLVARVRKFQGHSGRMPADGISRSRDHAHPRQKLQPKWTGSLRLDRDRIRFASLLVLSSLSCLLSLSRSKSGNTCPTEHKASEADHECGSDCRKAVLSFYLIWPLLILLGCSNRRSRNLIAVIAAAVAFAPAASIWLAYRNARWYGSPACTWGFGIGRLASLLPRTTGPHP